MNTGSPRSPRMKYLILTAAHPHKIKTAGSP